VPPLPAPKPSAWREYGRPALLLILTVASIYMIGGVRLVLGLVAILLSHEMGHYVACRYHRVDATLPHFIPSPWIPLGWTVWMPLSFVGTFGAVIRIRAPFPQRRALFDIGVAGPLAGFLVALPVLFLGVREATFESVPTDGSGGLQLGDPLLFTLALRFLHGEIAPGLTPVLGPLGLAAWFGLFMTALNLIPIGQLDGGHITYALLPRFAARISRVMSWVCLALAYFGPSWILWSILLRVLGRRHPPTLDDREPVGRARVLVGLLSLVVFVLCFMPEPVAFSWPSFFDALRSLGPDLTSR
jgi:membrane-associated protease RseP (regulator of RpoE activity)